MRIALESLDNAGKTTHIAHLEQDLQDLGLRTQTLASPAKNNFSGPILRKNIGAMDPNRANRLFAYDIERSQRDINPNADVVLFDRHLDTVRVSNTDPDQADIQIAEIAKRIKDPDRIIYLDIPPNISWARECNNAPHPIDFEWIKAKHLRYQRIIQQDPERFTILDATLPLEAVYQGLLAMIMSDMSKVIEERMKIYNMVLNANGLIKFVIDAPVEVKPNVFLPMFVNVKSTMADVKVRKQIAEEMIKLAQLQKYDSVLGLESGGSYYAVTIANELNLPVAFHRTKSKVYSGATGDIVGIQPVPGSRVLVVDDVYATGQSASRASRRLNDFGCVHELITAFSYSSDAEMKKRLGGVSASSVTYFRGLRTAALRNEVISVQEAEQLTALVDVYRNTIFD